MGTDTLLVAAASPGVRKLLIRARAAAMRGRLAEALVGIDRELAGLPAGPGADGVALGLLKAELLHLDRDDEAAIQALDALARPRASGLPDTVQFVLEGNAADVRMTRPSHGDVDAYYHLIDRRRQAGHEWLDYLDIVVALDEQAAGRHGEAAAALWRDIVRAYRQGYWRAKLWADARYARLCLQVGELESAAYHTVLGEAEKQVERLAAEVSARRDAELVGRIVRRMLDGANLARHFVVAAELVARIADIVPDALVPAVGEWVLPRCRETRDTVMSPQVMPAAWRIVRRIGHRLPAELADRLVQCATTHPVWLAPAPEERHHVLFRDHLAKAVVGLVYAVPPTTLPALADATLPLALDRVDPTSYADVVELLAHIADRAGEPVKGRIADLLFPAGQPISRILIQLDRTFGKQAVTDERLAAFAQRVADETRRQVQRVGPGETAERLPETLGVYGRPDGAGPVVTVGTGLGLAALARHRERLAAPTIDTLVRAVLDALADEDNIPTNRASLLAHLSEFADRADAATRSAVFAAVQPFVAAPTDPAHDKQSSVVAAFVGRPDEVRRMALECLAAFAAGDEERASTVGELIADAAIDPSPSVRRGAFASAARLAGLPADAVPALLMGLRDPDPGTAVAAFAAFADRSDWRLTRPNWSMFLLASRIAADSPDASVRRHAALAVATHARSVPSGLRREARNLLTRFEGDVSARVREAARGPSPDESPTPAA